MLSSLIQYFFDCFNFTPQSNASIDVLPDEVKRHICQYLDARTIGFFSMTSKANLHALLPVLKKIYTDIFSAANMSLMSNHHDNFICCINGTYYYRARNDKFKNFQNVSGLSGKILKVELGFEHCMVLTTTGLYCSGNDQVGEKLGNNKIGYEFALGYENYPRTNGFEKVQIKPSNIAQISLGFRHTLVLTTEGELYACGNDEIGHYGADSCNVLTKIALPFDKKIIQTAAGSAHNLILTEDGKVYLCGRVKTFFQNRCYNNWTEIEDIPGRVINIYAANNFSLIWTTEGIFGMGNEFGFGLRKINLPSDTKIKQIAVRDSRALILDENGSLYEQDSDVLFEVGFSELVDVLKEPIQQIAMGNYYNIAITHKGLYQNYVCDDDYKYKRWTFLEESKPSFDKIARFKNMLDRLEALNKDKDLEQHCAKKRKLS